LSRHLALQQLLAHSASEFERQRDDLANQLQIKDIDLRRAQTIEDNLLDRLSRIELDYEQYVTMQFIQLGLLTAMQEGVSSYSIRLFGVTNVSSYSLLALKVLEKRRSKSFSVCVVSI
jgi:hypothetical protein